MCNTKKHFQFVGKEITPEDYKNVGVMYNWYDQHGFPIDNSFDTKAIEETFMNHPQGMAAWENKACKCNVCGSAVKHIFIFEDKDGNLIYTGSTCASDILNYSNHHDMEVARKKGVKAKKQLARNKKLTAIYEQYPALIEDLKMNHRIINDIQDRLKKYTKISEKQVALVAKLAAERRKYEADAVPVPDFDGKVELCEMVISSVKWKTERFEERSRYSGSSVKHIVHMSIVLQHPTEKWKVWSNCGKFEEKYDYNKKRREVEGTFLGIEFKNYEELEKIITDAKGKTVKNVKYTKVSKGKDPYFGFGKRIRFDI